MTRRGPHEGPAVILDIAEIAEHEPFIRGVLVGLGVRVIDLDDVFQDVLLGAWRSSQAGRFRPKPEAQLHLAVRAWVHAIAINHASHYHQRAHRRYEVRVEDPWSAVPEPSADIDPGNQIDALKAITTLFALPAWAREVLLLAAVGYGVTEIARALGIPIGTAATRLRRARLRLAAELARRCL